MGYALGHLLGPRDRAAPHFPHAPFRRVGAAPMMRRTALLLLALPVVGGGGDDGRFLHLLGPFPLKINRWNITHAIHGTGIFTLHLGHFYGKCR